MTARRLTITVPLELSIGGGGNTVQLQVTAVYSPPERRPLAGWGTPVYAEFEVETITCEIGGRQVGFPFELLTQAMFEAIENLAFEQIEDGVA